MEMTNPSNNLGLRNADVMLIFISMLCQSRGVSPAMLDVIGMLMNPLINQATSLTNVGTPTRAWDNIDTLHIIGVHWIFYRSKGALDGI